MNLVKNFWSTSFCRLFWTSVDAKDMWERSVTSASRFVQELEVLSVSEGHRPASWQTVSEKEFIPLSAKWAEMGLSALPVKRVAQFDGFAHRHQDPVEGKPANICTVLAKDRSVCLEFRTAFEMGDHVTQGELLGFPKCCTAFFDKVWKEGYVDPIWQAAENSEIVEKEDRKLVVKAHPFSNPLLRYAGIRVGFHIPCSFSCQETVERATKRLALATKLDDNLSTLLLALLQMPMTWDVLHGIAVVKTPILYLDVQSVPCIENYIVEVQGSFVPREGA